MKYNICLLLATCVLAGCASSQSVLCVKPQGQFNPESESEFLSELNAQLPFTIPPERFFSKQTSNELVGWVVVENDEQKDVVKAKLTKSSTLKILQVEALTPDLETFLMKQDEK